GGGARGQGPSVLQVGGVGAAAGGAALELPQVPDRPRRPDRGSVPLQCRADRHPRGDGDRQRAQLDRLPDKSRRPRAARPRIIAPSRAAASANMGEPGMSDAKQTMGELFETGLALRREVLGAAYVDKSISTANDFMMTFQHVTTEWC